MTAVPRVTRVLGVVVRGGGVMSTVIHDYVPNPH